MLLHIGENNIVKTKEIIGVFDIQSLKKSDENEKLLDNIGNNKTIIVADNKKYFSNISVSTINKRLNQ